MWPMAARMVTAMYISEFWAGLVLGFGIGWISLIGLVYVAAKRQRNGNRRPK